MPLRTTKLFTYGTLRPTGWNFSLIKRYVRSHEDGWIDGILVDLGRIPALIPGDGRVCGVVLNVEEAALEITDHLEGHGRGFYERRLARVRLDHGHSTEAWVYEYSEPARIAHLPKLLVESSDETSIYAWTAD